jgi:hypothetical protein
VPIIVSREGQTAQKVQESGVADENYLQQFVSANPDSLPVEDIKENVRLMTIGREFNTSSGPIDILAVDDDGEIFIIETKLFKNPDKRFVMAQVLDYGAALWRGYTDPTKFISDVDVVMTRQTGNGLPHSLGEFYGLAEDEVEAAIDRIKAQLQAGSFRFVVLMDRLHARLKDLILFMNERTAFDIYAVEMEFYRHEGLEIVIPKVFGAEVTKALEGSARKTRRWDRESFMSEILEHEGKDKAALVADIMDWIAPKVSNIQWGTGGKEGSFVPLLEVNGRIIRLFYVWTTGGFYLWPGGMSQNTCFAAPEVLEELRSRLNRVPGLNISSEEMLGQTSLRSLSFLSNPAGLESFKSAIEWVIEKLTGQEGPHRTTAA